MTTIKHYISWTILKNTYSVFINNKYRITGIKHDPEPIDPFLFVANHAARTDPYFIGPHIKAVLSYLANIDGSSKFSKIISPLVGLISKKKGMPDLSAVRNALRTLHKKNSVGIFLEGDRSWDGETDKIHENAGILAKKAKVPVYMAKLTGNYLTFPRWAESKRIGKIFIEFKQIPLKRVIDLSNEELDKEITAFLYKNDVKDEKLKDIAFTGKNLAHGIQYALWLCPNCMSHDTIYGKKDDIICRKCSSSWKLNGNLRILPPNQTGIDLKDWMDWQKKMIKELCSRPGNSLITSSEPVAWYEKKNDLPEFYDYGRLELFPGKLVFIANSKHNIEMPAGKIKYCIDNFNKNMEFSHDERRYHLQLNGKNACKWIYIFRYLQGLD